MPEDTLRRFDDITISGWRDAFSPRAVFARDETFFYTPDINSGSIAVLAAKITPNGKISFEPYSTLPAQDGPVSLMGIFHTGRLEVMVQTGSRVLLWVRTPDGWRESLLCTLPQGCESSEFVTDGRQVWITGTAGRAVWFWSSVGGYSEVFADGAAPSLAIDIPEGTIHIACHTDQPSDLSKAFVTDPMTDRINRHIRHACSQNGAQWSRETAAYGISGFPSIGLHRGRPLVVFQADAAKRPDWRDERYPLYREGQGASIGYAWHDGESWRQDTLAMCREFVKRETKASQAEYSVGIVRPAYQWHSRPLLVYENDGTPRAVWMEQTNGYIMHSRWAGEGFGDVCESIGPVPQAGEAVHGMLQNWNRTIPLSFRHGDSRLGDCLHQAALLGEPGRQYPLIDLMEFQTLRGITHELGRFEKFQGNPIIRAGETPGFDDDMYILPHVLYLRETGIWSMYCAAFRYTPSDGIRGYQAIYAESRDGLHFVQKRHCLTRLFHGKGAFNRVPFMYPFRDETEADPMKRYKALLCWAEGKKVDGLATSPDGIEWTTQLDRPGEPPVVRGLRFTEVPIIEYTDPLERGERKYKSTGRIFYNSGRGVGMQSSGDCLRWTDEQIMVAEEGDTGVISGRLVLESNGGLPAENQIYYGRSLGRIGDHYLMLYAAGTHDFRYQLALAASRDGRHFSRVKPGSYVLPAGGLGQWDNGIIFGGTPQLKDGKWWFYYGSSGWHHNTDKDIAAPLHRPNYAIGLAWLQENRWAYVRLAPDVRLGVLVTKPIPITTAARLQLDMEPDCSDNTGITAELLPEAGDEPLDGFDADQSMVSRREPVLWDVRWRGGELQTLAGKTVRLRINIVSPYVHIYGFMFE